MKSNQIKPLTRNRSRSLSLSCCLFGCLFGGATAAPLPIVNGDFETGMDQDSSLTPISGWTDGGATAGFWLQNGSGGGSFPQDPSEAQSGSLYLSANRLAGAAGAQPTSSTLSQVVAIDSGDLALVQSGQAAVNLEFYYHDSDSNDSSVVTVDYLDSSLALISTASTGVLPNLAGNGTPYDSVTAPWTLFTFQSAVPENAEFVSISIQTNRIAGSATNVHFDNFSAEIQVSTLDSDNDGLNDTYEQTIIDADEFDDVIDLTDVAGPNDLPTTTDFDQDGLSDADEFTAMTDPLDFDTDFDGLDDGPEVAGTDNNGNDFGFGPTNPLVADSDGDTIDDGLEMDGQDSDFVSHGFGPTNPNSADGDSDGLPDLWEIDNGINPNDATGDNGAAGNPDGDDVDNAAEFAGNTDPLDPNSNGSTVQVIISGTSGTNDQAIVSLFENNFENTAVTYGDFSNPANIPTYADVFAVGRFLSSAAYANAANSTTFNELTIPVISFTSYVVRQDSGRWGWHASGANTGNPVAGTETTVTTEGATAFGVAAGSFDWFAGAGNFNAVGSIGPVGGGEILATMNGDILAAHWSAGSLTGLGATLGGDRLLFNLGQSGSLTVLPSSAGLLALIQALETYTPLVASGDDTDGDGLPDIFEFQIIDFDEFDGVADLTDVAGPNDAPATTDFDFDGLNDADEFALQTNPTLFDSDNDGLDDGPEVAGTDNFGASHGFGPTSPTDPDSDGDGLNDGPEIEGTDNLFVSHGFGTTDPNDPDTDNDTLPDGWEIQFFFDPNDDGTLNVDYGATGDPDSDGLLNGGEFANNADPFNPDTDGDGLGDKAEVDGTDNSEISHGFGATLANDADSDDDGFTDLIEVSAGSDPNNGALVPGTAIPFVNGGFESPTVSPSGAGIGVLSGTIPGWSAVENDFYVTDVFTGTAVDVGNPLAANEGNQFATAERRAPDPDVEAAAYLGGVDAVMSMQQVVDVSSLAASIDSEVQTLAVTFDFFDGDVFDNGIVSLEFLNATNVSLGRQVAFETDSLPEAQEWQTATLFGYPPVGTRSVRVSVTVAKAVVNATSARNVHFDDFRARLFALDADMDGMADIWELANGLNPGDAGDAPNQDDTDALSNLTEFQAGTDPFLADTDGDGFNDDVEVAGGSDPLDAASTPTVASGLVIEASGVNGDGEFELTLSGLNPSATYSLVRGLDLQSFPTSIVTRQAGGATDTFVDPNPPAGAAFYRLEEQP